MIIFIWNMFGLFNIDLTKLADSKHRESLISWLKIYLHNSLNAWNINPNLNIIKKNRICVLTKLIEYVTNKTNRISKN